MNTIINSTIGDAAAEPELSELNKSLAAAIGDDKPKAPRNTEEMVEETQQSKREGYNLLASFIPLVGAVIWIGMILVDNLVVQKSVVEWRALVATKESYIQTNYSSLLLKYGEFVVKTQHLSGIIELDIKPENLFILVDELFPDKNGYVFTGFSRASNGAYSVSVSTPDWLLFTKIARRFNNYEKIHDVRIEGITKNVIGGGSSGSTTVYTGTITFFFNGEDKI